MKFIGNVANGKYFIDLVRNLKVEEIQEVYVAVAYATSKIEIFDFCFNNKIPLKFWGRYDKTVPVSSAILKTFIDRSSALYRCFLIKELFHPKVYWFKGYGAYIGSANIGERAWVNNVEAGVFFTDSELENLGMKAELEDFFSYLSQPEVSTMLNKDIYNELLNQEKSYLVDKKNFDDESKDLVTLLTEFRPAIYTEKKAEQRKKDDFLREWNATLNIIRDVMKLVTKEEFRPNWLEKEAAAGVLADQFLHAFYYTRTRSEKGMKKYLYEEHHEKNKSSPQKALEQELLWWSNTSESPNDEDIFISKNAPKLKSLLSREKLLKLSEDEFVEIGRLLHAFKNVARYFPPKELNISDEEEVNIEIKRDIAARKIFSTSAPNGKRVPQIIEHVLYGGPLEHVVHRLYDSFNNRDYYIPRFGRSCYGEIVGWALPDHYPPRNDRTNKALRALGYDVVVWNPGASEE